MAKRDTSNMAAGTASVRPRAAMAARAPRTTQDIVSALPDVPLPDDVGLEPSLPERNAGLPERKYSFNALVAVGIAGFLVGRLLSR
ncbi:hypothetical protein [Ancylobacter oerskovii]|uniref:DUF3618 domain-containing protein n=1 Tax=Ancylobacter oerskovii TaxID=459519 RepID=A0ABW4Z3C3_9HYPH|nr:hypothetical protein [Ancylobacter oerskovii]MBS7546039.1 hypothetical protein [Ancylobacter oerskovii]